MRLFKDFGMKIDWELFDVVNCYDKQMVVMIGKVGMFFMFLIKCLNVFLFFIYFKCNIIFVNFIEKNIKGYFVI